MITIAGAGLAGLSSALELARAGHSVRVYEASENIGSDSVSRYAGGMLAPYCERESADQTVVEMANGAADWWEQITPVTRRGALVVAPPRDQSELVRFSKRTTNYEWVPADQIAALEPALDNRFANGLFFEKEAHLDPRTALRDLAAAATKAGVEILCGTPAPKRVDLDCTGPASNLPDLRMVRGEMAILHCPDLNITRTIRLLHPRIPLYLVPRGNDVYMIGATMIESSSARPISVRSLSELLSAAFAIHPSFAEATVIETGSGLRPAFPDNLPRLVNSNGFANLNGFYRHGFLLAPAMAAQVVHHFSTQGSHENHRQFQTV